MYTALARACFCIRKKLFILNFDWNQLKVDTQAKKFLASSELQSIHSALICNAVSTHIHCTLICLLGFAP